MREPQAQVRARACVQRSCAWSAVQQQQRRAGDASGHTFQFLGRSVKELCGFLAIDIFLCQCHVQVHQQRERVHILELIGPEDRAAAVGGAVLRVFAVLNELADECLRRSTRCGLPERRQRVRVLEYLLGAHRKGKQHEAKHRR